MSFATVEHKIRVFISSRCGDKYTIARKALKELLLSTGLIGEVYAYESEPASSENNVSSYLSYVDDSNLCIFLVDNQDDVTPAVISEQKRAKDTGKRQIYIFCDEREKCQTAMQKELIETQLCKFSVVHEFADFVKQAYYSTVQDIIAVYKKKDFSSDQNNETKEREDISANIYRTGDNACFIKSNLSCVSAVNNILYGLISSEGSDDKKEDTKIDKCICNFLHTVICTSPFEIENHTTLTNLILVLQPKNLHKFFNLRFEAVKYYYLGDYRNCINCLQSALQEGVNNKDVPNWLALDVAIDLRNLLGIEDEIKSRYSYKNEGQKFIDESPEALCYPEVDRFVSNYQSKLMDYYAKIHFSSPYEKNYGGVKPIFGDISKAFCVAVFNGSIIHLEEIKHYIVNIMTYLSDLYSDYSILYQLIRGAIITRDDKLLKVINRSYNAPSNILNSLDLNKIMSSVENIPFEHRRIQSKFLALKYFGYYFDDNSYMLYCDQMMEYSMNWIEDKNRLVCIAHSIFEFMVSNSKRIDNSRLLKFIFAVLDAKLIGYYNDCLKVLCCVDYKKISESQQEKVLKLLLDMIGDESQRSYLYYLDQAIIYFAKSTVLNLTILEDSLKNNMKQYYDSTYCLEMCSLKSTRLYEYIEQNISMAKDQNKRQGIDGGYITFGTDPLATINNIVSYAEFRIEEKVVNDIVALVFEIILNSGQTISAKIEALELLITLYNISPDYEEWSKIFKKLVDEKDSIKQFHVIDELEMNPQQTFLFVYNLLLNCYDKQHENELIDYLFTLDKENQYEIIQALKLLQRVFSYMSEVSFSTNFLSNCVCFLIMSSLIKERDVIFCAIKCLIAMSGYSSEQQRVLQCLSKIMDTGTADMKIAIVSRIKKIRDSNKYYTDYIIKKALADNNYLVRFAAKDCSQRDISD